MTTVPDELIEKMELAAWEAAVGGKALIFDFETARIAAEYYEPKIEDISSAASECAHQLREAIMHLTSEWSKQGFLGGAILLEMEAAIASVQNALAKHAGRAGE